MAAISLIGAGTLAGALSAVRNAQGATNRINTAASYIDRLQDTAAYNSAQSAQQAQIQRDWQVEQNAKAMQFSASEAAKNRNWQEYMSNTAHQREVADLKAAGLNPVLSAMGGNGAAVTSGATASGVTSSGAKGEVDTSMNSALVNLLGSIYNRTTQLEAANINARTQEAVADKYNATSEIIAQIGAATSRYQADSSRAASKYASDSSYAASKYSSDNAYMAALNAAASALEGTKYSSNSAKEASRYASDNAYYSARDNNGSPWTLARNAGDSIASAIHSLFNGGRQNDRLAKGYKGRTTR